jgi:hypothetical protein
LLIFHFNQTFTNALLTLLAYPQYIETIREECEKCIQEEGWSKAAMDKMVFLDSFMKESQRVDVVAASTYAAQLELLANSNSNSPKQQACSL